MKILEIPRSFLVGISAAVLLASCAMLPNTSLLPKVLVSMVVDGFARFLAHGNWFANANYANAFIVTAAGHVVMLTGSYTDGTGIIGNKWREPETGAPVYSSLIYPNVSKHLLELPRLF